MLSPVMHYANITNTFTDTNAIVSISDKQRHTGMYCLPSPSRKSTNHTMCLLVVQTTLVTSQVTN